MPSPESLVGAPPAERAAVPFRNATPAHARHPVSDNANGANPAAQARLEAAGGRARNDHAPGAPALVAALWHGRAIWITAPDAPSAS